MAENERIDVTTSDVVALRECRAKYELSSLNLKNSKSKKEIYALLMRLQHLRLQ